MTNTATTRHRSPLLTLNNGLQMPALGLGVFQSPPEETAAAVASALAQGYRLIDAAAAYFNERQVGEGVRRSGIARDDVFIETKVWISDYGYDATLHAFDKAARKLGVDRIDLLLLHSHPRGQILIVTAGTGRVQRWGDAIEEIRAGDVVRIPACEKHWHGASPRASMTHMTVSEHRDGTAVQWMEKVTDEQYNAAPQRETVVQPQGTTRPSGPLQQKLAPGLAVLTDDVLYGDVWRRTELSPRDRSLVTISVLIATGKPAQLAGHLGRALDNGVLPREASGVLAHLAIYSGWPNAVSSLDVYEQVYTARKVDTGGLRDATPRLPAAASDGSRAHAMNEQLGTVAPKFVQLTNDVVFGDLWRRSDLTVRDRSLVTIAALSAMGDDDQLDGYLHRAIESGLTRAQITEALTHLAFYAGWAKATKAITAVSQTLGK